MTKHLYIDTETTGLDHTIHAIVQVAGLVEIDGRIKEEFQFRLRPYPGAVVEDSALLVSGLPRERIAKFPPESQAYQSLKDILGRYVDPLNARDKFQFIGYNARFDMDMLRALWTRNGDSYLGSWFWFPPLDVMGLAAFWLRDKRHTISSSFSLEVVARMVGIAVPENLHDALVDVRLTRQLMEWVVVQGTQRGVNG